MTESIETQKKRKDSDSKTETHDHVDTETGKANTAGHTVAVVQTLVSATSGEKADNSDDPQLCEAGLAGLSEMYPDGGWKAYLVVFGSFVGLLVNFGIINSIGAVQAYVLTHQLKDEKVLSVSWVFSIFMCLPFFLGALVGPVFDKRGSTMLLIASTVLLVVGFVSVSFSNSIVSFVFALSICIGTAHALAILPLVSLLSHWFLLNRGKALGLATLGGSVGGMIWPLILQALYSTVGFAWAIRIVGAISLFLSVVSILLVKLRFKLGRPSEKDESVSKLRGIAQSMQNHLDFRFFRDPKFASLVAGVFLIEVALMSILTYLASYALAHGFNEKDSLLLLTILNASGIPGRYLPGIFADRYGCLNTMVLMLTGFCISIFAVWLPFGHIPRGLYAFAVLGGFFSSSILSLTPVCLGSFTPVEVFGRCYGLMYSVASTGILFGVPVGSAIIGDSSTESYRKFAAFCGAFALAGTLSWSACRYLIAGFKINVKV